ncbi:hypothetical protein HZB88_02725 [archaeon]|nr:hypothetical protein [archaeon]
MKSMKEDLTKKLAQYGLAVAFTLGGISYANGLEVDKLSPALKQSLEEVINYSKNPQYEAYVKFGAGSGEGGGSNPAGVVGPHDGGSDNGG